VISFIKVKIDYPNFERKEELKLLAVLPNEKDPLAFWEHSKVAIQLV
jgi:hypothetical protein